MALYGAVELGGTRAVVTIGTSPEHAAPPVVLATRSPDETLSEICEVLEAHRRDGAALQAVGVGAFGPLGLDPAESNYGRLLGTPKPGWSGADVRGALQRGLGLPVWIDTDVNAAALGEGRWGASAGLGSHAYVTVGTGVGVGLVIDGRPVHGLLHPEGGHVPVRRDPARDPYRGCCPWHGDCLEGLVCGPALAERIGGPPAELSADDQLWTLVGDYLGEALAMVTLIASPERIVLGGGVGRRPEVLKATRARLQLVLAGYVPRIGEPARYLVSPGLGEVSGLMGALALAQS